MTAGNTLTRLRNINRIPFRGAFSKERFLRYGFRRAPQDRLTHDQILFTWNPYPRRSTRMSLVCLLLPPRSVLATAPCGLASSTSTPSPHSSYSYQFDLHERLFGSLAQDLLIRQSFSITLKRHPFSELNASVGELLHTP